MAGHLTETDIAALKQQLLEVKTKLDSDLESYRESDMSDSEEQEPDELADYDPNDPADIGTNLFDRERDMAIETNTEIILGKIHRAMQKLDEGTYGLSDIDGSPIPLERLQALPYAVTTIEQEEQGV